MTLAKLKAWSQGFTEDMDGRPAENQWKRIKERVSEIDGTPITREVFVDRYRYYPPVWVAPSTWVSTNTIKCNASNAVTPSFDGTIAMANLGRSESAELNDHS